MTSNIRPEQIQFTVNYTPERKTFLASVRKEAKRQAERIWSAWHPKAKRGRPLERNRIETATADLLNERFAKKQAILYNSRLTEEERERAIQDLGEVTQGKLIGEVQKRFDSNNPGDGSVSTPHEDTILKYVKADRLLNRMNPDCLSPQEAQWLAKHHPSDALSLVRLTTLFPSFPLPEPTRLILLTAKSRPPKK